MKMKVVIIGGSGLIGTKLMAMLKEQGYDAIAASTRSGVNTFTGEGLDKALEGASVVVDVSNSPSFEDSAVLKFFETTTHNILAAEAKAGVKHHVALSIVGIERLPENGYFRAKIAQEQLIKECSIPYSIIRATQFFEFVKGIADEATQGNTVRVSPMLIQPIAGDDVASALFKVTVGAPLNGTIDIAGPEAFHIDELLRQTLKACNDPREVVTDVHARYFGAELSERTLVPDDGAQLGAQHFKDWFNLSLKDNQHKKASV